MGKGEILVLGFEESDWQLCKVDLYRMVQWSGFNYSFLTPDKI